MTSLTKRKKGKSGPLPSILGKLYGHRVTFGATAATLSFVSTARFNIQLASDPKSIDRDSFALSEVGGDDLSGARAALAVEHSLTANPDGEDSLFFRNC
jgi:hypothetical protein